MSISEIPPVRITYSTVRDICDDIWAGAIHYAKEVGFSLHPMVTTVLWSGLLLSVAKDIEEHGILQDVQAQFPVSFTYVYGQTANAEDLSGDMQSRMMAFYETISKDFIDLDSERKIFDFVSIATNVNDRFSEDTDVSLVKAVQFFQKTASLLSSHIYGILHEINNGILLRFPNPRFAISPPPQNSNTQPTIEYGPNPPSPPAVNTTVPFAYKTNPLLRFLAIIGIIAVMFVVCSLIAGGQSGNTDTPIATQPTNPQKPEAPRPPSGTILAGQETGESYIEVTASQSQDCVVTIKTSDGVTKVAFFVRADSTVAVNVPAGDYYVYFAAGSTWYGYSSDGMFGTDTSYSMDDELRDFTNYSWTYTLYPVSNGNFSETPISKEEFWFG